MKPAWLEQLDEARIGKARGYILEGNVADKVYFPESGIPAIPMKYFLAAYLAKEGFAIGSYSLANGFEELRPPMGGSARVMNSPFTSLPNDLPPDQVLAHMTGWLRRADVPTALILDYADHMAPVSGGMSAVISPVQLASLEVLHAWGLDENIRSTKNIVFLISYESQVNDLIRQSSIGYKRLTLALPARAERRQFIGEIVSRPRSSDIRQAATLDPEELARATAGLPLTEIEEILNYAAVKGAALDHELIRVRKKAVIHQLCSGLLDVHDPECGFEGVSGLPHAKEELSRVIRAIKTDPSSATQALLLVGVPGCGKSWLVQALAKELGYPCLALRNMREGLVGASERNLERVLWVAETLSPCLIWVDEIDQALGQRNTGQSMDAGTSERMMARLFEFMGSLKHRGQILWVGTSNRPDILDSALLDRFQLVIPFLHPSAQEVEEMLPMLALQVGRALSNDVNRAVIARLSSLHNPTVRGLQEVVARAGTLTDVDTGTAGSPIDHVHLMESASDYKPNYNPLQHAFLALNAVRMASFTSVLPWRSRAGRRPNTEIPDYLADVVDADTGDMDSTKLSKQLDLLGAALQVNQQNRRI